MTHGSLFSGIGGFDLAAEWIGWQNVFHCEWNTFGQKVLKHYWPNAISYHDITKTDFTIHRGRIDILTGGFPCQPYSMAGKRLGKEDDRHLWPEMLRAIREIQPRWVVGENVLGLVNWSDGLVFHEVQADLEAEGYEVQPFVLPAVSVNAPHRRDRVWFVAHAKDNGYGRRDKFRQNIGVQERSVHKYSGEGWDEIRAKSERPFEEWSSTNSNDPRADIRMSSERERQKTDGIVGFAQPEHWKIGGDGDATDTTGEQGERVRPQFRESCEPEQGQFRGNGSKVGSKRDVADTKCSRLEHRNKTRNLPSKEREARGERGESSNEFEANDNGECNAANSDGIGSRGESDGIGNSRFFGKDDKASNWENFPTVSPICDGNDGLSDRLDGITFSKWRNESIKAGGNAVVPQVVLQIFRTIEEYEKTHAQ